MIELQPARTRFLIASAALPSHGPLIVLLLGLIRQVIQKERLEEERRLDTIMEVERLKALKMCALTCYAKDQGQGHAHTPDLSADTLVPRPQFTIQFTIHSLSMSCDHRYSEREQRRLEDQKNGAAVIITQMQERERERVRQLELQDQEREAMLKQNEDMKADEVRQMVAKRDAGKKLLEQVAASNAEQIELKKAAKDREKNEEVMIQVYLRQREKRDQERMQAEESIKAEKERETARLRAQQEKLKDKQAELDALRAKRAAEEAERQWRKTQQLAAEREMTIQESLALAREAQKLEKERRLIEQAQQEKEEFDRILRVQREAEEAEYAGKSKKMYASKEHMNELQAQILMNAEVRKKNRMEFLDEGVQQRARMEADRLKLEGIKKDKLRVLESAGVPAKYTVDLTHKKFTN